MIFLATYKKINRHPNKLTINDNLFFCLGLLALFELFMSCCFKKTNLSAQEPALKLESEPYGYNFTLKPHPQRKGLCSCFEYSPRLKTSTRKREKFLYFCICNQVLRESQQPFQFFTCKYAKIMASYV